MRLQTPIIALLLFASSAFAAHVAYSLALTAYASVAFTVRGPNIRYYPIDKKPEQITAYRVLTRIYDWDDAFPLTTAYVRHRLLSAPPHKRMLTIGSSLSWGYPMNHTKSLAGVLQESMGDSFAVADASTIGYGLEAVNYSLCHLRIASLKPTVLFIEIATINAILRIAQGDSGIASGECSGNMRNIEEPLDYFGYFFKYPDGISYIARLRPSFSDRDGSRIMRKPNNIPRQYKYDVNEIEFKQDVIRNQVAAVLETATASPGRIVVFFAPIHRPAYRQLGVDDAFIDAFVRLALDTCREYAQVTCLEPFVAIEQEQNHFFNITHLNRNGMERLAEKLIATIQ